MDMIETSGEGQRTTPSPIFASSWMALYLLLRREFGQLREAPNEPAEPRPAAKRDRTN